MAASTILPTEPSNSSIELNSICLSDKRFPEEGEKVGAEDPEDCRGNAAPPPQAVEALQKWNSPSINRYRVFATFWSFFVLGMNDGSYGALLPHLETYYELNYTIVSLVFLSPFAGYTLASAVNNLIHVNFGQRGVAFVAPLCHFVPYLVFSFHPPYPVLIVMFVLVGFGNGLIDAAWCAWIGAMAHSHEVSGVLQACYALGATISPLIATTMISTGGLGWYAFYYIMVAVSTVEFFSSVYTFWAQTGAVYLTENPREAGATTGRTRETMKNKITWIFALFIFVYSGAEVSLGGWIVVFMTRVRNASSFVGGAAATGFWGGMTVGRLFLPFLTMRIGEFRSMILYLSLVIILELIFWLVPNLVLSAVSAAFLGMFMGPMFPTAIVVTTKLLPRSLHVGTIGFGTSFGGSGGAIFPFIVGALAQAKGVKTLQPFILALCVVLTVLWILLPRTPPKIAESSVSEIAIETRNADQVED